MPDAIAVDNTNGTLPHDTLDRLTGGLHDRILIFDACRNHYRAQDLHARDIAGAAHMEGARLLRDIGRRGKHTRTGRTVVLWSCNDGERALESTEMAGGVFTRALLESLEDARARGDAARLDVDFVLQIRARIPGLRTEVQAPAYSCVGGPILLLARDPSPSTPPSKAALPRSPAPGVKQPWLRRAAGALYMLAGLLLVLALLEWLATSILHRIWPGFGLDLP